MSNNGDTEVLVCLPGRIGCFVVYGKSIALPGNTLVYSVLIALWIMSSRKTDVVRIMLGYRLNCVPPHRVSIHMGQSTTRI